jgi:hypothetical protein
MKGLASGVALHSFLSDGAGWGNFLERRRNIGRARQVVLGLSGTLSDCWLASREPSQSVTFDLSPVFSGSQAEFAVGRRAINALALVAMIRTVAVTERLLVLDWQHPSYWFWPHRQAVSDDGQWPVEVFPNGDYCIFLTEDMTAGTFGHPWEETLCVFGERFVSTLVPMLASWLPVKRSKP